MKNWTPHTAGDSVAACFAGTPLAGPTVCHHDAPGNGAARATVVVGVAGDAGGIVADAARRAEALGARLVLVHVHPAGRAGDADHARHAAAAAAALRSTGAQATVELRPGRPATVLAGVAREVGASTIVVGSRRPRWARRRIGVVGRVLGRTAPCPVVLVPA